jgi:hypothetical protein
MGIAAAAAVLERNGSGARLDSRPIVELRGERGLVETQALTA